MNPKYDSRILVIGGGGSGKSTLARQLGALTGFPVLHLDYEFWQPGWVQRPPEEFAALQTDWLQQHERWIIDGNYIGTMEPRFAAATLVILLDLPRLLRLWRIHARRSKPRPDLRDDLKESFNKSWIENCSHVWNFRKRSLPAIFALREKYPDIAFVRLRSRREVARFLTTGYPNWQEEICR
ncbi:MAG: hypothetical protein LBG83_04065 [Oscillospiraceae bacterium]|jgi:adenylate kinase family enzyme|nr:hypothetical protein [Oscillospiraceae bacterium]